MRSIPVQRNTALTSRNDGVTVQLDTPRVYPPTTHVDGTVVGTMSKIEYCDLHRVLEVI